MRGKTLTLQRAGIKFPPLNCLLTYTSLNLFKRFIIGCAYVNDNDERDHLATISSFYHRRHLIPFSSLFNLYFRSNTMILEKGFVEYFKQRN
jgi:hypothetical protein